MIRSEICPYSLRMYSGREGFTSGDSETLEPTDEELTPPVAQEEFKSIRVPFNPDKVKPLSIVMMVRGINCALVGH